MGAFHDGKGDVSMGRIGFAFCLLVGAYIAIHGLWIGADLGDLALLVGVFIGGAFGGKGLQKFAEREDR